MKKLGTFIALLAIIIFASACSEITNPTNQDTITNTKKSGDIKLVSTSLATNQNIKLSFTLTNLGLNNYSPDSEAPCLTLTIYDFGRKFVKSYEVSAINWAELFPANTILAGTTNQGSIIIERADWPEEYQNIQLGYIIVNIRLKNTGASDISQLQTEVPFTSK